MPRLSIVLAFLLSTCAALEISSEDEWSSYKRAYGKQYTAEQETMRYRIFKENVELINKHNRLHSLNQTSYRRGLSRFTDMTKEELRLVAGWQLDAATIKNNRYSEAKWMLPLSNLPTAVDWRTKGYVTRVKDQGRCASCWAFSATGSLEGQHFAKTGTLVSLSEQNLIDCSGDYNNKGCAGGRMSNAFEYILANGGINTEEIYPYTGTTGECKFHNMSIGATITGYEYIPYQDEKALQQAVATIGPISASIFTGSIHSYESGVYDDPECKSGDLLLHAVLVVGYGTTNKGEDYWLVKNSWGEQWGDNGYIRMARNKNNQCGIASFALYPTM